MAKAEVHILRFLLWVLSGKFPIIFKFLYRTIAKYFFILHEKYKKTVVTFIRTVQLKNMGCNIYKSST